MNVHPAALVLADHLAAITTRAASVPAVCECGWRGAACDYPAHLADVLLSAGLLAGTAEERRVLAYVWSDPRTGERRFIDPREVEVAVASIQAPT